MELDRLAPKTRFYRKMVVYIFCLHEEQKVQQEQVGGHASMADRDVESEGLKDMRKQVVIDRDGKDRNHQ